jgi:transcription antitermination factor NusG
MRACAAEAGPLEIRSSGPGDGLSQTCPVTDGTGVHRRKAVDSMAETLRTTTAAVLADSGEAPRWYACYTKARHEKRAFGALQERGMEAFLPLAPRLSQWKDRKKLVEWPLFPSYVFGRLGRGDLYRVLDVPGVSALVKTNGRPAPIPDEELENVRRFVRALGTGAIQAEHRPFFAEGEWVEIIDGPLQGVHGVVIENRGAARVLVGLRAIGQGMEVNVNTRLLRAVAPR